MTGNNEPAGREQLLRAALRTIARHGVKGATFRLIADNAGVTNGLIVHHFGTKAHLIQELDARVTDQLRTALTLPDDEALGAIDASHIIATQLSGVIGEDADLRAYVRRSLLEAGPAGHALFSELVATTTQQLERFQVQTHHPDAPVAWLAVQTIAINLAGLIFEPFLAEAVGPDPFSPDAVTWRTHANRRFIEAALGFPSQHR